MMPRRFDVAVIVITDSMFRRTQSLSIVCSAGTCWLRASGDLARFGLPTHNKAPVVQDRECTVRIRSVLQEYEAQLKPTSAGAATPAHAAHGKAEWKAYGDGTRKCKVWVSRLNLPEGAVLELAVNGQLMDRIVVRQGAARYKRESDRGEAVPVVEVSQVLQVCYMGQVILEGEFYLE
jgi:hypothetical protein